MRDTTLPPLLPPTPAERCPGIGLIEAELPPEKRSPFRRWTCLRRLGFFCRRWLELTGEEEGESGQSESTSVSSSSVSSISSAAETAAAKRKRAIDEIRDISPAEGQCALGTRLAISNGLALCCCWLVGLTGLVRGGWVVRAGVDRKTATALTQVIY